MKLVKVLVEDSKNFEQQNNNRVFYCSFITEIIDGSESTINSNVYLVSDDCIGGIVLYAVNGKDINYFINEHVNKAKNALRQLRTEEFKRYDLVRLNIIDTTSKFLETSEEKQARLLWFDNYKNAPNNISIINALDWQTVIPVKPQRLQIMFDSI